MARSDGRVVIDVILNDGQAVKGVANLRNSLGNADKAGGGFISSLGKIAGALGLVKIATVAWNTALGQVGAAVARYDTMNTFPKVMESIGFSADESKAAIDRLSDGVTGLPTALNEIVASTQNLATLTGDLDLATEASLALNNAFLASGTSSADASRGLTQYVQMLSSGKVDAMSWRTLLETMGPALNDVSASFGYFGSNAKTQLYDALQAGEITFDELNLRMIELSSGTMEVDAAMMNGRDSIGGFADRAKTASGGIATAFANMRTAVTRGVTNIIEKIDEGLSETRFKSIEGVIVSMGKAFGDTLSAISSLATPVIKVVADIGGALIDFVKPSITVLGDLVKWLSESETRVKAVVGIISGLSAFYGISKAITAFTTAKIASVRALRAFSTVTKTSVAAQKAYTVAQKAHQVAVTNSTQAQATYIAARNRGASADHLASLRTMAYTNLKAKETAAQALSTATVNKNTAAGKLNTAMTTANIGAITSKNIVLALLTGKISTSTAVEMARQKAEATGTIVTKAQTAALIAKNVVVGAYQKLALLVTGQITLMSVAQGAWTVVTKAATVAAAAFNAVLLLNPVVAIAAGVAILTAGIYGLVKAFTSGGKGGKQLKKDIESLDDAIEEHNQAIDDSTKAYERNKVGTQSAIDNNNSLMKSIMDLSSKEKLSKEEKARLAHEIDQLNNGVEGLSLAYDKQTASLNMANEELQRRVEIGNLEKENIVAQERLTEIEKERIEIGLQIEETNKLREKAVEIHGEESKKVAELDETYVSLEESLGVLDTKHEVTTNLIVENNQRMADATESMALSSISSLEELSDEQKAAFDRMKGEYEGLYTSATDAFSKMEESKEVSLDKVNQTLEHNRKITEQWGNDVNKLYSRTGAEGVNDGFIEWVKKMEQETPGFLNTVANASNTELAKLATNFEKTGESVDESMSKAVGEELEEVMVLMQEFGPRSEASLREAIEMADFPGIGRAMGEGAAEGAKESTDEVVKAVGDMGEMADNEIRRVLDINSPSGVFIEHGQFIGEGLALGVENSGPLVVSAFDKLAKVVEVASKAIDKAASDNFVSMGKNIGEAIQSMEQGSKSKLTRMSNAFKVEFSKINSQVKSDTSRIRTTVNNEMNNIDKVARTNLQKLTDTFKSEYTRINNQVKSDTAKIVNAQKSAMDKVVNATRSGMQKALNEVKNKSKSMITDVNKLKSQFQTAGAQAVSGLVVGINNNRHRAITAARNLANAVSGEMKKALAIKSPSRLWRDEIGKMLPAGMAIGIEDNAFKVERAVQDLANLPNFKIPKLSAEAALGGTVTRSASISNVTNNYNTTNNTSGGNNNTDRPIVVQSVLDGRVVGETVNNHNGMTTKRMAYTSGVRFA